ncbi:salicylate 1-monooxygenase [Fusarium phyllophilum]|uniref:Salicylate 1-monooxygenase n=1 Tax=Fusarium phyllophilum TaxID=47803 RepID=A0A8H5NFI4_9HYPO|nr:salicylate 1-monooxygenase [Fusarium phyllophilum]
MSGLKVLVSGASIAGPATAYWLAKAGAKVTVIERFPALRTGGQAVDIRTAGVSVMRKMAGLEAAVRAKSTQEEGISFVREDGTPYGVIRPTVACLGDNNNINYIFDKQIASMQQSEKIAGPITVTFAKGTEALEYDLVIACDGATSRTRALGLGCNVGDHIVSTNCWSAYFSIPQDVLSGSKIGQGFNAVRGRNISIGTDPAGFSRVLLMCMNSRGKSESADAFREASAKGNDALKKYIAQHYSEVGWKCSIVLKEMTKSEDFYASEIVQVKTPTLSKGRLIRSRSHRRWNQRRLAGAYILAGELSKHKGDITAGLEGYEQQVRPLVNEMQVIPPLITTILAPQTAWGIWLRNNIFAFVAWTGLVELAQRYIGAGFGDAKSISNSGV